MKKVMGAWYVDTAPNLIILESMDKKLWCFDIAPYRTLTEDDLKPYKGKHPRKAKGLSLPSFLFQFYGLERDEETCSEIIHMRVTPSEKEFVESYGENHEPKLTNSDVFRSHIYDLRNK
jgi:hypothetical protein